MDKNLMKQYQDTVNKGIKHMEERYLMETDIIKKEALKKQLERTKYVEKRLKIERLKNKFKNLFKNLWSTL